MNIEELESDLYYTNDRLRELTRRVKQLEERIEWLEHQLDKVE